MADTGRSDPFTDVISLVAGPIAAVIRSFDQLRRGAEELMRGLENFNTTMENLNETATRINRLLNDFEAPIRAMVPQLTRTVKLADEISKRLSGPIDQVVPGLNRLADTLNAPVFGSLPRDLSQFVDVVNDLSRRMSPLAQLADQAGGFFGLRIPGLSPRPSTGPTATPVVQRPAADEEAEVEPLAANRSAANRSAPRKSTARQRPATKKAAAKRSPAKKAASRR